MQNKEELIVLGIDVSKNTLDVCVRTSTNETSLVIANNRKSVSKLLKELRKNHCKSRIVIGFENTGIYNYALYDVLREEDIETFVFHPLDLAKSMGMTRGKTDKIDAKRIAAHLHLHYGSLTATQLPSKNTLIVKALMAKRSKLVKHKTALFLSNKELQTVFGKQELKLINTSDKKLIQSIEQAIKALDTKIDQLLLENERTAQHMENIRTVQGVGPVLAAYLAIKTNGFTTLTDPRKLACYAGVVPFDYQSGKSIYKRPRVSYMADKELKRLLHLAALRVIQLPGEMRQYYIRKVAEGKNKMSVINAIRNKIIARICSCINNNKKYQKALDLS